MAYNFDPQSAITLDPRGMMETYTSVQGDTADLICRKVYGDESGFVEVLFRANPGLANTPIIPTGTIVNLPELARPAVLSTVNLWE